MTMKRAGHFISIQFEVKFEAWIERVWLPKRDILLIIKYFKVESNFIQGKWWTEVFKWNKHMWPTSSSFSRLLYPCGLSLSLPITLSFSSRFFISLSQIPSLEDPVALGKAEEQMKQHGYVKGFWPLITIELVSVIIVWSWIGHDPEVKLLWPKLRVDGS